MNKHRRQFLKNTSCCAAAVLFSKHLCAEIVDLPQYCSLQSGLKANGVELLTTSGDADLDQSISLELTHIAESFHILPGFGFYDEGDSRRSNAFATAQTIIPNTKGTVVFGKHLLSAELFKQTWGGLVIAGVIAHEFAHIYQFQTEVSKRLNQGQSTARLSELHADFLAGYYLGLKRLRNGEIDIKAFLDSLYLRGDMDFTSPFHHGTPLERKQMMLEGYKIGLSNLSDLHQVAEMGVDFVKNI